MPINSRTKGAAGERELARKLREYGYDCRRGQQYSGANGDADVVGLPRTHIECKRVEKLNLDQAYEQSVRDARVGEIPIVAHRKNGTQWKVTLSLDDFMKMYSVYERTWNLGTGAIMDKAVYDLYPDDAELYLKKELAHNIGKKLLEYNAVMVHTLHTPYEVRYDAVLKVVLPKEEVEDERS